MPDDAQWAEHLVVPDDLRDLQPDVEAYHREQRHERRARHWHWLTESRAWQRWSFPLGMLTGALGLAAVLVGLLAIESAPSASTRLRPAPIASTAHPPGSLDALIPDVMLAPSQTTPASVSAQALRPSIVALVPLSCNCMPALAALAKQAANIHVGLDVVAPGPADAEVAALPGQLPPRVVSPWYDLTGELSRSFAASGLTVLVVDADGIVSFIGRDTTVELARQVPVQSLLVLPPTISHG